MKHIFIFYIVLSSIFISDLHAQSIVINATSVVREIDSTFTGINLNYLMDDDSYLKPTVSLLESLRKMHVSALRFPGGEKSDNYLWSQEPYEYAQPQFATPGNCNWPNTDKRFSSNAINPLESTLDFDEFMLVIDSLKASALIVVSGDAHYCDVCPEAPSFNVLLKNAVEWVRYANVKKKYNIKYWMIGNESFNAAAYGKPSTATQYANDVVSFSKAMKEIDPSIKIVANSKPGNWLDTLLLIANEYIDAVALSNYPVWDWKEGYLNYRNTAPDLIQIVNQTLSKIGKRPIEVIVSEYNSMDWNKSWENNNDMGHALVNFQMFGDLVTKPGVSSAFLWNTRWVDNVQNPQSINDAIDSNGNLNSIGKALSLWGENLLNQMVSSGNSGFIRSFATREKTGTKLNVFVINKDTIFRQVDFKILNYEGMTSPDLRISMQTLSGDLFNDKFPGIESAALSNNGNSISVKLNPVSANVIKLDLEKTTNIPKGTQTKEAFTVFPNPFRDIVNISANESVKEPYVLSIYNIYGLLMYQQIVSSRKSAIDLSFLPNSFYLLKANGLCIKIIKNKSY